jgi:hypothetical protein
MEATKRKSSQLAWAAGVFTLGCLGACSTSEGPVRKSSVAVSVADFNDPTHAEGAAAAVPVREMNAAGSTEAAKVETPRTAPVSFPEVSITAGAPTAVVGATETGVGAEVDAKVGDINGRAIFASSFLEEMGDRMRAQAQDLYRRAAGSAKKIPTDKLASAHDQLFKVWVQFAQVLIRQKLENELQVELLRAEAASSFTAEQKQGFLSFLQKVQNDLYSESGGSRSRAGDRVSEQEGKTIDEYLKSRKTLELVRYQLQRKVFSRVNVSWRDVQLEYDKRPEAYVEPPKAIFRVILVDTAEQAKDVETKLASGTSFVEIAESPVNSYAKTSAGGKEERVYRGQKEKMDLFGPKPMNEAARQLTEGQWAGPFSVGSSKGFLYLEKLILDERELYDVQLRVEDYLKTKRQELETARYIDRLKQRASFTNLDEMTQKLVGFAQKRYFDPVFVE